MPLKMKLDQLLTIESKPKKKIGYTVKEKQKKYGKRGKKKRMLSN